MVKKSLSYKYIGIFLLTTLFFLYFFAISIHSALPTNAVAPLPLEESLAVNRSVPQGWGFYSKDPKESTFHVIDIETGVTAAAWPNNRPINYFGLKRYGRSQGIEAGVIRQQIDESAWQECEEEMFECMRAAEIAQEIENPLSSPTICGEVGYGYQEPVPWAWSKSREQIEMPSRIARVKITCTGK
ncbi:SdpA family antimicrobial peptide system protein [Mechercharimyces sp. CAU 1602]|uniref:SdpA family antimicrobial peptide system protein n=1 Tax=Mechercharimyces sp. CAU 1602 TaxID=2973933 RepID=UPI002162DDF0|nr:SdpA family antimicrobial peptide system protein [Mechercharimyces sp. CAU 1602]MCS1352296.1 SdpA family antimicrobial peptide system protein [Mechercharimyces sp. CAU 1602]